MKGNIVMQDRKDPETCIKWNYPCKGKVICKPAGTKNLLDLEDECRYDNLHIKKL